MTHDAEQPPRTWPDTKLAELAALPDNWDGYGAVPIDARAILSARQVIAAMAHAPDIVARGNGGIQLEWHRDGIDVEIEIPEYGGTAFFADRDNG